MCDDKQLYYISIYYYQTRMISNLVLLHIIYFLLKPATHPEHTIFSSADEDDQVCVKI